MQAEQPTTDMNEPMAALKTELSHLNAGQRAMVVDFARRLRKASSLMLPDVLEGAEYEAWLDRVGTRSTQELGQVRQRLIDAGITPDGDFPHSEWPGDMAPSSKTSVTT